MTKAAIRKAFQKLDPVEQADVLGQLVAVLSHSLLETDRQDARVFDRRRAQESRAIPLTEVKRRLAARRRGKGHSA